MTPEGQIVRDVMYGLKQMGILVWRNNSGKRGGVSFGGGPGMPDIMGVLRPSGRLLAIECKSATGKLRPEQRERLADFEERGALVIVARSIEDIIEGLQGEPCGNALSALSRD